MSTKKVDNPVSKNETQNESQAVISKTEDSKNVKPASASFDVKVGSIEGAALKTEKIAQVIQPDSVFGGQKTMGFDAAGGGSSGTGLGFLADQPKTPSSTKTRGSTRFDKKVEKVANHINFTPSEQFEIPIKESKPLAESGDLDQGFNGTYRTNVFRLQKKSGASPAELEYQRSVDFIHRDMIYYSDGQTITKQRKVQDLYPSRSCSVDGPLGKIYPAEGETNFALKRSNYILDDVQIGVSSAQGLEYVLFKETEIAVEPEDSEVIDVSSGAYTYSVNRAVIERDNMDVKAGDESKEGWSPLPRAVEEPTKVVALLHDMEYITGTELFLAKKKLETSFAFQLNRAIKDGQDINRPGVEFMSGLVAPKAKSNDYCSDIKSVFNVNLYGQGAASLIVALYDSDRKYNSKADFLLQPRGPRMHLASLHNAAKSFRVNPIFVNAFNSRETFGTIDHDYDPSKPIMVTDKCVAAHPISLAKFGDWGVTKAVITASDDNMEMSTVPGRHLFPAGRTIFVYYKIVSNTEEEGAIVLDTSTAGKTVLSLTNGLVNEFKEGDKIELIFSEIDSTPDGYIKLTPTNSRSINLGVLENCSYSIVQQGYLNQGSYYYGFSDERNSYVKEVNIPLVTGIRAYLQDYAHKIRAALGSDNHLSIIATHSTVHLSLYDLLLAVSAEYMATDRKQFFRDISDYAANYGYPFSQTVTLDEAFKQPYRNMIFSSMDEPLKTVVIDKKNSITWKFPEIFTKMKVTSNGVFAMAPWYINESEYINNSAAQKSVRNVDKWAMSWPSIRGGNHLAGYDDLYELGEKTVRLALDRITDVTYPIDQGGVAYAYKHGLTTDGQLVLNVGQSGVKALQMLQMPRELGWSHVAPAGFLTNTGSNSNVHDYVSIDQVGTSCYRTWVYHNIEALASPEGNSIPTINTSRGADYVQYYAVIDCIPTGAQDDYYGVSLGSGDCYCAADGPIMNRSAFAVITSLAGVKVADPNAAEYIVLSSDHTNLYYRVNVLPFVINPYDGCDLATGAAVLYDPFELSYAFGLAGFRASDYSESVYNHMNRSDNLGRLLVSNSWVDESYLV